MVTRPAGGWSGAKARASEVKSRSRRSGAIAEGEKQAENVAVLLGRRRDAAGDPVEEQGVALRQQRLVAVELIAAELVQMPLGERAEQQIGLLGAAMPAAEQQPLAADLEGFGHGGLRVLYSAMRLRYRDSPSPRQPRRLSRPELRPEILFPLFAPVTALPGVGPRFGKLVERLAGAAVIDLLWHLPSGIIDRRFRPKVAEAPEGVIATITVEVVGHLRPASPRQPYRVRCRDETGFLHLVFFHVKGDYLEKLLPVGARRVVSGRVEHFNNEIQITHPDHIVDAAEGDTLKPVEPVYGLTTGLPLRTVQKAVAAALARAPALPEWLDPSFLAQRRWQAWREALATAHAPEAETDLALDAPARQRLAYDELLANQLAIALVRAHTKRLPGRAVVAAGTLRDQVLSTLPFSLTPSQRQALAEIAADMAAPTRMLRLLQGDVGSGKTVVALLAMLDAVEAGAQAALMAPTEILARQHAATLAKLGAASGVAIALLTGREKGRAREAVLARLAGGEIGIVVGTHALFQEDVVFKDLALAVIDEQHRFGVEQRIALSGKGRGVDILVMTATPIPRTLMLTSYGDLDASRLTEKPAGRRPITTRTLPLARLDEVVEGVARALAQGAKVYWICPLVEESEAVDLAAVDERHAQLAARFGARVGLVHGRMKGADKDRVMEDFATGAVDLLVATTVVEVGVDVPDATVMVVEHAERFGLAQLHQLRGRIGRGDKLSACLLVYATPLGATAKARLEILRDSDDGFRIAEEDLRLRGAGEVLGTRQSGLPELRLADLAAHADLLAIARDDARLVLTRDPELLAPRGEALRVLLYLFQRDQAVRYLRSG
jgi:ATP-dependent DNA helicase RecG